MFADDIATPYGMDPDLIHWPLANQAFTSVPGALLIGQLASCGDQFRQSLGGATGGIFLQPVM